MSRHTQCVHVLCVCVCACVRACVRACGVGRCRLTTHVYKNSKYLTNEWMPSINGYILYVLVCT